MAIASLIDGSLGDVTSGSFYLVDAADAAFVLVSDRTGIALLDRREFVAEACTSIDESLLLERGRVQELAATVWLPATSENAVVLLPRMHLAAYLCGVAEVAQATAASYAMLREQFGRPIGGFQAIKHMCADMVVRTEAASCQTLFSGLTFGREDFAFQVAASAQLAIDAARRNCADCLQIHGGIGYTMESEPQRLLKRAQLLAKLLTPTDSALACEVLGNNPI